MIIGVGADLSDIRRIQASLDRFGDRFKQRCFTELERTRSDRKPDAGLELCQAVRGQGGLRQGAGHRHAARRLLARHGGGEPALGQPTLALTGHAAEHLARLTPPGHEPRIHLTLSDEHPYALAFVVIEALPMA